MSVPISGAKATYLLYHHLATQIPSNENYACFCTKDKHGCSLELYPRSNGDLYVCGLGSTKHIYEPQLRSGAMFDAPECVHPNVTDAMVAQRSLNDLLVGIKLPPQPDVIQVNSLYLYNNIDI